MDTAKRTRLIQILGMMGSAHDGEILNAAKMAQRLLGAEATTWGDILNGGGGYTEEAVRTVVTEAYDKGYQEGLRKGLEHGRNEAQITKPQLSWQVYARILMRDYSSFLTEWEAGFVDSFIARAWPSPTAKQKTIFERLAQKTGTELPR
jgi:hypothetical protein